ncbi:hypothetical protein DGWBC_1149 [Dehalogenimonas sp. WBC-2]|nr:hypothetical protein DGWBC_1149 [Dehalogenimonas sp. WBC-2]
MDGGGGEKAAVLKQWVLRFYLNSLFLHVGGDIILVLDTG